MAFCSQGVGRWGPIAGVGAAGDLDETGGLDRVGGVVVLRVGMGSGTCVSLTAGGRGFPVKLGSRTFGNNLAIWTMLP
jgi:hypothetical protein